MTTTKYRYRGRIVDADQALDEDGCVRDGFSLLVPLTMRDSHPPLRVTDGSGDPSGLHRPGPRITTDAAARSAKEAAYAEYLYDATNAWRGGDPRKVTQRDPQGRVQSTFEEEDDEQQCDGMTLDAIEARHRSRMADEYRRYDERVRNMWRNP